MAAKEGELLTLAILLGGAYLLLRRTNSQPGTFAPNAPGTLANIGGDILPLTVSDSGLAFIKHQEGLSLKSYPDAGHTDIGYGHQETGSENYSSITELQANDILANDVSTVEQAIYNNVTVPLNQNQFDALADFVYNVGVNAFKGSTLLKMLNTGNYSGASAQFLQWTKSQGQQNSILATRRAAEQSLFNA